jgi:SAM-dependent methyltransferase
MYESYLKLVSDNHFMHSLSDFETLNLTQYSCPSCGASDRDRLYALFADLKFRGLDKSRKYRCIEFAPSTPLSTFFRQKSFLEYRSADLFMEGVDDKVDLTDMKQYRDNSIDMFICSHVLEHVNDDLRAMRELHRILKKDGWGIVMVPLLLTIQGVHEDPEITTDADRWKHFGQNDHVRLYSKQGFIERLDKAGFKVSQYDMNFFGTDIFETSGISPRSVLYIVEK